MSSAAPLADAVTQANGPARFYATLVTDFAGIALVLAAVAVFNVMSYAVSQRTAEIGALRSERTSARSSGWSSARR